MLIEEHGVGDNISVICARSFDVELEREFDLVVSETIGYLGYDEGIVEVMVDARSRFLRDGGHIIPETVSLLAAAGKLNIRTDKLPVGIDVEFSSLSDLNLHSPRVLKRPRDVTLLTRPARLVSTDLRRVDQRPPLTGLTAAWVNLPGRPDCVVVWAESRLAPMVRLSTRRRTTSWYPTLYRISPPSTPIDRFEFKLTLTPDSNYWTATFDRDGARSSASYSPEYSAARMVAAAREVSFRRESGSVLMSGDGQPPQMIELRGATPGDDDFLRDLYETTRAEEVRGFGWDEAEQHAFLEMQFTMQKRAYLMQHPNAQHSIIWCDGQRAGRILVDRSGGGLTLVDISVHPDFRKRGIASQMLKRLQAESDLVLLSVDKTNLSARRLYEKFGFMTTGENEFIFTMRWERS
jgi:ribosomal protein S18 acetylase RimI-like enzyme